MEDSLPVVEYFHSLQGEGAHVGRSAFFIRLALCKVGCPWCDTKESWISTNHINESPGNLSKYVSKAQLQGASFVVITGGEPLHHNLNPLCKAIRQATTNKTTTPIAIHLETSGVDPLTGNPDWITLSPKKHAPPLEDLLAKCDELKVVIQTKDDILFAEKMANSAYRNSIRNKYPMLFLQAGWDNKNGHQLAFEYVKKHPKWRLSMQTHKWLGVR